MQYFCTEVKVLCERSYMYFFHCQLKIMFQLTLSSFFDYFLLNKKTFNSYWFLILPLGTKCQIFKRYCTEIWFEDHGKWQIIFNYSIFSTIWRLCLMCSFSLLNKSLIFCTFSGLFIKCWLLLCWSLYSTDLSTSLRCS